MIAIKSSKANTLLSYIFTNKHKNVHYISFCNVCLPKHKKGRHIHADMTASTQVMQRLILLHLYLVETLAIRAYHCALRDERLRIYGFHQPEYGHRLAPLCHYHHDFRRLLAVPARAIEHSHAAMSLFDDGVRYLLILCRKDEELHRLAHPAHYKIERRSHYDKRGIAEHNFLYGVVGNHV